MGDFTQRVIQMKKMKIINNPVGDRPGCNRCEDGGLYGRLLHTQIPGKPCFGAGD